MRSPSACALLVGALLFGSVACATSGPPAARYTGGGGAAEALVNTALALTASGISRAQGGCYAACPAGTACDGASGLCQPLPCRDSCAADQHCDEVTNTCVRGGPPADLGVRRTEEPVRESDYWDRSRPANP